MIATTLQAERVSRISHPPEAFDASRRSFFSELIRVAFPKQPERSGCATVFTSPDAGSGVSFICSYVATELAVQGSKVLLADARSLVALSRRYEDDAFQLCERVEPGRVWVLGAQQLSKRGPTRKPTTVPLSSLLDQLGQEFQEIVIDAPATSVSDDALLLSAAVYGTVLVVEAGRTEKRRIVGVSGKIASLGGRILGSVYNSRA